MLICSSTFLPGGVYIVYADDGKVIRFTVFSCLPKRYCIQDKYAPHTHGMYVDTSITEKRKCVSIIAPHTIRLIPYLETEGMSIEAMNMLSVFS